MSIPDAPEYLTAPQLARVLQVSEASVYRWAAAHPSMPVLRVGGVIRFPRERIFRWLRDREQGPARPRRLTRSQALSAMQVCATTRDAQRAGEPCAVECADPSALPPESSQEVA